MGLSAEYSKRLVGIISKNPKVFVDFMMVDELELPANTEIDCEPQKQGLIVFVSFIIFGLMPLLPYLGGHGKGWDYIFGISIALACVSMFALGVIKGYLTAQNMLLAGVVMLVQGAAGGGISYGIGVAVEKIVTSAAGGGDAFAGNGV
jgi:VIT1/CCC1 family predicted Fe2+/Mn2+ transporter